MTSRPEKLQKANHCRKETISLGHISVICLGKGSVTTMMGKKISLSAVNAIATITASTLTVQCSAFTNTLYRQ